MSARSVRSSPGSFAHLAGPAGLARLALRRCVSGGVGLAALALAALLPALPWAPAPARAYPGLVAASGEFSGGLLRQGVWATFLAVIGALLLVRSAGTVALWRRGEVDWLATTRSSRLAIVLSDWLGKTGGVALLLLIAVAGAELRAPGGATLRKRGQLAAPHVQLLEPDASRSWRPPEGHELRPGHTLRAQLVPIGTGGGATADVRFAARRGAGPWVEVRRHLARRTGLELVLPPYGEAGAKGGGDGPLELVLARAGPGAVVVLEPGGLEWLVPAASARAASWVLFARAWLALSAACALALGLGAWVRPGAAAWLVCALALVPWNDPLASPFWPWHGLPQALVLVREGLVPAPPAAECAGAVACILIGLVLAVIGLRDWKRPP